MFREQRHAAPGYVGVLMGFGQDDRPLGYGQELVAEATRTVAAVTVSYA